MSSNISVDSTDSDVFYVEQISNESSPQRNNSQDILNSTERSEHHAMRMPSISTIASPSPTFSRSTTTLMSQPYHTVLGGSSRSFPPAWTIWICRLTRSTSWQPWLLYTRYRTPMMTKTPRNHRTLRNCHLHQLPLWMWARSTAAKHHIPVPMTIRSIQAMSHAESTGTSRQMMISALVFQGIHLLRRALVLPRRLKEHRRENWACECAFQKRGECRRTSAKPADRRSPQRTSLAHQTETRTVKITKLLLN